MSRLHYYDFLKGKRKKMKSDPKSREDLMKKFNETAQGIIQREAAIGKYLRHKPEIDRLRQEKDQLVLDLISLEDALNKLPETSSQPLPVAAEEAPEATNPEPSNAPETA
jgi:hypothetical protein